MRGRLFALLLTLAATAAWAGCSGSEAPETDGGDGQPAAMGGDPRAAFVGNWELVRRERIGADGELLAPPEAPAPGATGEVGYIMYDAAGYMGVVIQPPGRPPWAEDEPTGDEAVGQLGTYTSYFGTFTVNPDEGYVTHHLLGNVRPPDAANNNQRFFEFAGDELILMPPPDDSGVTRRIIWRRVPDLAAEHMTEAHRRLFGFYRFEKIERFTSDGESLPVDQWDDAFIIYMPSGHMAVHISRPDRPVYSGAPTPEQALGAVRSYGSYFGPFSVNEEGGYLVHHRIGNFTPGAAGTDAQRFFELTDTHLTLRPPARPDEQGRMVQGAITWARISD